MQSLHASSCTTSATTMNDLMTALVAELLEAEGGPGFDPLAERLTLIVVIADLCRLAGEPVPEFVRRPLAGSPIGRDATRAEGFVTRTFVRLLAELQEELSQALYQRFTLGLLWADLCRLADERVPADVEALLDTTVVALPAPRRSLDG